MVLLLLLLSKLRLKDLFEIRQGVTMVKTSNKTSLESLENYHYKVINLSSLNTCHKSLKSDNLVDYYSGKEINPDKCLTPNDYLISCKGVVKGFSLFFSDEIFNEIRSQNSYNGILASNHFFILSPREISQDESPLTVKEKLFLHNLMDIVVEELNETVASNKSSTTKYLTINEVGNFLINYPFKDSKKIDDFSVIFDNYYDKLQEFQSAKIELDLFNKELKEEIIVKK